MIEVEKELLTECFALLGVANFEGTFDEKRIEIRDKLIKKLRE